jgi:hypothetical protein
VLVLRQGGSRLLKVVHENAIPRSSEMRNTSLSESASGIWLTHRVALKSKGKGRLNTSMLRFARRVPLSGGKRSSSLRYHGKTA